jgi:hypothetical protein
MFKDTWLIALKIKYLTPRISDLEIVTPHVSKPHDYVNHMFMRP